jgi:hypothetical protein
MVSIHAERLVAETPPRAIDKLGTCMTSWEHGGGECKRRDDVDIVSEP